MVFLLAGVRTRGGALSATPRRVRRGGSWTSAMTQSVGRLLRAYAGGERRGAILPSGSRQPLECGPIDLGDAGSGSWRPDSGATAGLRAMTRRDTRCRSWSGRRAGGPSPVSASSDVATTAGPLWVRWRWRGGPRHHGDRFGAASRPSAVLSDRIGQCVSSYFPVPSRCRDASRNDRAVCGLTPNGGRDAEYYASRLKPAYPNWYLPA